jgi:ATP-dependent Clp protease protease subunit
MNGPMRVIEGNALPGEAFWRFVDAAKSESGETEVEFYGPISEYSWFGDEITPKAFKDELNAKGKGGPVTLKVNSPGGEVFAAAAIRNILVDYPGKVTADIIGLAASAATVVVGGADLVKMRDTAMFMIHDPSTIAWGTLEEMRKIVEVLDQVKETILNGYQAKTKQDRAELARLMSEETWMTAQEAKDLGFVDEVISEAKPKNMKAPKAMRAAFLNCVQGYKNIPEAYSLQLTASEEVEGEEEASVIPVEETSPETDSEEAPEQSPEEAELRARVSEILGRKES